MEDKINRESTFERKIIILIWFSIKHKHKYLFIIPRIILYKIISLFVVYIINFPKQFFWQVGSAGWTFSGRPGSATRETKKHRATARHRSTARRDSSLEALNGSRRRRRGGAPLCRSRAPGRPRYPPDLLPSCWLWNSSRAFSDKGT